MIKHSKVVLDKDDISSVLSVLRSGQIGQGEKVFSFEQKMAAFIGVKHAVAVSSGTAALHLALLALGVGENSEVIIPSYVCTALLHAVHYVRATPVLVDIGVETYNILPDQIENAVSTKTAAIIVPHMFGLPADMDEILSFGIPVIEDCAQAVGAKINGEYVGSFGKASILSLYATKMLCAGEGGLVLSDDVQVIERVRDLRDYDEKKTYALRYNYKLTDIQAALGESQLKKLASSIRKRKEISGMYNAGLEGRVLQIPIAPKEKEHVYHRYVVSVKDSEYFIKGMNEKGVECRKPVFKPLHRYLGINGYPGTELVWSKAVSIPLYPSLTKEVASGVVKKAIKTLEARG